MQAIRVTRKLDSETIYLPELQSLIGKTVEITVTEEPSLTVMPDNGSGAGLKRTGGTRADWEAALADLTDLDIDWDAYQRQREFDTQHAQDHLP